MWYTLIGLVLFNIARNVSQAKNDNQVREAIAKVKNKCNTI